MKVALLVVSLLVGAVLCEPQAPYAPSGWKPNGPAFDLPQRASQSSQSQQYLPPVDPRNKVTPSPDYATPEEDVSVQGLPTQEQQPIFQVSPINGQQYVGPNFNSDIRNLDQELRQSQFQKQQEIARQFARQRQLEAAQANAGANNLPNPQVPGQFVPRTTARPPVTFTPKFDEKTTQSDLTTESLNDGEIADDDEDASEDKDKVSVEISRQNIQAYSPELFLSPLTQLKLQPQLVPLQQLGQIRAPLYYQPVPQVSQKQVSGFSGQTHFAALPSVLAQKQVIAQPQGVIQTQGYAQPALLVSGQEPSLFQQPLSNQYQPQVQGFPQYQPQTVVQQQPQQPTQFGQPKQPENDQDQNQPQFVYQQSYQPQELYIQPQAPAGYQPGQDQQGLVDFAAEQQYYQSQQQQQQDQQGYQGQDAPLQSGFNVNQQRNGIDQTEQKDEEDDGDQGSTATAVATAFGARTQPRVFAQYGVPVSVPRVQGNAGVETTVAPDAEETTDEAPVVAEATAVARGSRRKSAKLRTRRVRPLFTLDKSGHLVLAQEQ